MIISASRRTDIPTYYSQWFLNRIKERYVLVRNPMNTHQVSKINLSPDLVDCIVFWTKNPKPMLEQLEQLKEYNYYFQFTLNAYGKDIETNVPSKNDELIETFKRLSDKIGPEKVIWRYDPIFLNSKYTVQYHIEYFRKLAKQLTGYTEKCTISFIDFYRKINNNIKELGISELSLTQKQFLAENLSRIAFEHGLKMDTCAEDVELKDLGIQHASCIDAKLISRIIGTAIDVEKDKNQRLACGCIASIDIGLYNTCLNGCKYCYANYGINNVMKNSEKYHPTSPLLCSQLENTDTVKTRVVKSFKQEQISLFNSK
jgi:DNA repair photolyase